MLKLKKHTISENNPLQTLIINGYIPLTPKKRRIKMNKNWLTINEIASYLNVSRTAIVNAINRKEIPTTRVGRRILIKQDDFQRYLYNIEIKGKNAL
jgi:DNA binding domain protein, excisionase family